MNLSYDPTIFDVETSDEAKQIILTNEGEGLDTETRWKIETPYLVNIINQYKPFRTILDYGCGIGRLSKELIAGDNFIVGADISLNMRTLSIPYVSSDNYIPVHPRFLNDLNLKYDLILAVWVLQHVIFPQQAVKQIASLLKPGGKLFLVNNNIRVIPCRDKEKEKDKLYWATDNVNIKDVVGEFKELKLIHEQKFDPSFKIISDVTYIRVYQRTS